MIIITIIMHSNENINQHLIWKENSRLFFYLPLSTLTHHAVVFLHQQNGDVRCRPSVTEPTDGAEEPLSKQPNERLYQGVFTMWAPCTKLWLMVSSFFKFIFIILHFCSLFFGGLTACVRTATNISTDVKYEYVKNNNQFYTVFKKFGG